MRKAILTYLLLTASLLTYGQELKERRVYYLDCSYSMVNKKLWEPVCKDLIHAIQSVNDEKTELMVIPFAMDNSKVDFNKLAPISAMADGPGKAKIIAAIQSFPAPQKNTMTYLRDPLGDFQLHRVAPSKVTYMFLMTDGLNEEKPDALFQNELSKWGERYGEQNVYGFYVMLDGDAKSPKVEEIINSQPHLWKVETANVNINLIRLHNKGIFNARNEKYFELPVYGNINGKNIKAQFGSDAPCQITKTEKVGNKIRFYVRNTVNVTQMPVTSTHILTISMTGGGKFDFLVTDKALIEILSKPERSLKINMR